MKLKAIVVFMILASLAVAINFRQSVTRYDRPDEKLMETKAPPTVGEYEFLGSTDNPLQSYRMDDATYELLQPFGIVARIYEHDDRSYDVVVIGGDNADSFHDQRACFRGQGWEVTEEKKVVIPTETRGEVPAWLLTIKDEAGHERQAAFLFRGPTGFHAEFMDMWWDFFRSELKTGKPNKGIFYRFIARSDDVPQEEFIEFAGSYLDEANRFSDGWL